jgi:hypothetical protein
MDGCFGYEGHNPEGHNLKFHRRESHKFQL